MGQYWYAPSIGDEGQFPTGFVNVGYQPTESVGAVVLVEAGEPYIEISPNQNVTLSPRFSGGEMFSVAGGPWSAPGDIDLYCDMLYDHTGTFGAAVAGCLAARRTHSESFADRLRFYIWGPNTHDQRLRMRLGSSTLDGAATFSRAGNVNLRHGLRFNLAGDRLRGRHWLLSDAEPAGWGTDITDTSIASAGEHWAGLGTSQRIGIYRIYGFGIGTNGDPAPTGPVGPGGSRRRSPLLLVPR